MSFIIIRINCVADIPEFIAKKIEIKLARQSYCTQGAFLPHTVYNVNELELQQRRLWNIYEHKKDKYCAIRCFIFSFYHVRQESNATRDIDIGILSVRTSVRHAAALYGNGLT